MADRMNEAWLVAGRPKGADLSGVLLWNEAPARAPEAEEILVRIVYLSIDPTNRVWMNDADSYLPKLRMGETMRGIALGVVEESKSAHYKPGDLVQGLLGWQKYATVSANQVSPVPKLPIPLTAEFGLLGHIGLTAYYGLLDVAQAKEGETLVVSAAAGAVGSLAAQIGKIIGMDVVGIAGGEEKCSWLRDELQLDDVIDYRKGNLDHALHRACPDGIDVYFDNVGGEILDAVLGQIRLNARIALCGMISQYNDTKPRGPSNFGNLLVRRGRIQGFIVLDYLPRAMEATKKLLEWHLEGKLKYRVDVMDGLRSAPAALEKLFAGANKGKMLVKVSEEPA
jgi:NADPH-dependent curcumin reductase